MNHGATMESPDFAELEFHTLDAEPLLAAAVEQASELGASDLFLLTDERATNIALRQWGRQRPLARVPLAKGQQIINIVKSTAGMDLAEKRRPLDGRYVQSTRSGKVDVRVSSIPTLYGEDLTLRLMNRQLGLKSLHELGMDSRNLDKLKAMLASPSGLVLVTGPTGTGKTTTLYACLQQLNDGRRKINTLEDPIEYAVEGFRQSQVNAKLGLDFADLLRSIIRQAPDVIMIGEIRDEETAATAVRAANSGHLVFATLHAPVAAAAVHSMLSLGAQPHFLASCLLGVVAQRLVRKLCVGCRVEYDFALAGAAYDDLQDLLLAGEGKNFFGPGKCEACAQDGYSGRQGVFEVLPVNRRIRELVAQNSPALAVQQAAIDVGMIEFRRAALLLVAQGVTSMEEILATVPIEYLGLDE